MSARPPPEGGLTEALALAPRLLVALARTRRAQAGGRPRLPYKLECFLTWRCTSRCGSCAVWRRPPSAERDAGAWAETVRSAGPGLLWLSVTGGEVSLRDDLGEVLTRCLDAAPSLRYLNLSSNGLHGARLEAALAQALARRADARLRVTLSLDGIGARHDALRGVPGGFLRVLDSAERLASLARRHPALAFTFQCTLTAGNRREWPRVARLARRLSVGLSPVFSPASEGALLGGADLGVDLRRAASSAIDALPALLDEVPVRHPEDVVTRRYLHTLPRFLREGAAPVPCTAGYASLTIEPEGAVRRCDSLDEVLGHVDEGGVPGVLGSRRARDAFAARPECRACWTPCQAYPSLLAHPLGA